MKKILHIFKVEKFTEEFIIFINDNFVNEKHTFWIHGDKFLDGNYDYLDYPNVEYMPRIEIRLNKMYTEKQLNEFDLIIYHWVIDFSVIEFFLRHKKLLKKLILYFWGGDRQLFGSWKERLIKRYVIEHSTALITITPGEAKEIEMNYHPRGKIFSAMYDSTKTKSILDRLAILEKDSGDTVNIQIGNSAYPEFHHISILKQLSKYKEENIKIFVPLSYGVMEYAEQVIEYGRKIFGNKFIPLRDFIPLKEFYIILQNMDVAIMDIEKQHALGNIYALIRLGCKMYFREDSLLYNFFLNDVKCKITPINQIEKMDITQFAKYSYDDKWYNRKKVCEKWDEDYLVKQWKKIFDAF